MTKMDRPRAFRRSVASVILAASITAVYLQMTLILCSISFFGAVQNDRSEDINSGKRRQLVHVVSPFLAKDTSSSFAPLSLEQWNMLVSIKNAQQGFNATMTTAQGYFDSVLVVCAILSEEYDALHDTLAPYCQRFARLSSHTALVYPKLLSDSPLPFIQDIVDAGMAYAEESSEDFYLMLTNADICLTSNFYTELAHRLARNNKEALSINRKVLRNPDLGIPLIPSTADGHSTPHSAAMNLLQRAHDLINTGKYRDHGGYDCFILHSSVLTSMNFGSQFVGFPFWGTNVDFALSIMAENYRNVKSRATQWGTFHLGDANNWMPSKMYDPDDNMMTEWKEFSTEELEYLAWCPVIGFPPQDRISLQNAINCGKWFRPLDNDKVRRVPAFVNDGYDTVYLKNSAKHLNFTSEGLPIVNWKRNSSPTTRLEWIQRWG